MLDEKRRQIEVDLAVWAASNSILLPGQQIHFTIQMGHTPLVAGKVQIMSGRALPACPVTAELTDLDWQQIFSFKWQPLERNLLEQFRGSPLCEIRQPEIKNLVTLWDINAKLCSRKALYLIRGDGFLATRVPAGKRREFEANRLWRIWRVTREF